jgi:hypothetical protein
VGTVNGGEAANVMIWRTLVKLLYEICGSPEVPGYPESHVQYVLTGRRPIEPRFTNALITACLSFSAESSLRLPLDARRPDPLPSPDHEPAGPAPADLGKARERRSKARTGPPPDPANAATAAQFMQLMRELRAWAGMSLRGIEEASRRLNEGRDWIPRSSLADVLNRDTLPRPELLETFTAALALPIADRAHWTAAHRRLLEDATLPPQEQIPVPTPEPVLAQVPPPKQRWWQHKHRRAK